MKSKGMFRFEKSEETIVPLDGEDNITSSEGRVSIGSTLTKRVSDDAC
jgi:hypothetical protein